MRRLESLSAIIALVAIPTLALAQPTYNLIDLGAASPYDGGMTANSINDLGHVVGYGVINSTGEVHAYIYGGGVFTDLGLLGYQGSDGIAINDSDQLAVDGIGPGSTALFYSLGRARTIGNVDGGYTSAYAINSHGDIVGSGRNGDNQGIGFSWIGGVFTDLSAVGILRAASINDADQIAGSSGYYWFYGGYGHSSSHACSYAGGVFTDLGNLTGDPRTNTEAYGINNAGKIVGYSTASDNLSHAFLYSGGVMQDLGTMYGADATAIAINDNGLIIGTLTGVYGAAVGSFVVAGGTMSDLASLIVQGGDGWTQLTVTGLSGGGTIVGYGLLNGLTQGFVATPTAAAGAPSGHADLATGIAAPAPNPFRAATEIGFSLSQRAASGNVRLEILDVAGRRVAALLDQRLGPGRHSIAWNGRADGGAALGSGIYFARLTTQDGSASRRLVLER